MSAPILERLGRVRALEGLLELAVPFAVALLGWRQVATWLATPTVARGFTPLELIVLMGALGACTGWAVSRALYLARRRRPWVLVLVPAILMIVGLVLLPGRVRAAFLDACKDPWKGEALPLVAAADPRPLGETAQSAAEVVCRVGGVPDNPYLPGVLLRPSWSGALGGGVIGAGVLLSMLGALGTRHRRMIPTRIGHYALETLRYAPASGSASLLSRPASRDGGYQACVNPTFWGETCGQLVPADQVFAPGEPCPRCRQPFNPTPRRIGFDVVSLWTADVDVLNGLERVDTLSWPSGTPIVPDARVSGVERWVKLGRIELPDVITVAQALALVHERLPSWAGQEDGPRRAAVELAQSRASRISAWIWAGGGLGSRLTYARPDREARLAVGTARLRDVVPPSGGPFWLQLDVGLLPLELRLGFRSANSAPINNKTDLWVPTGPAPRGRASRGLWVPRVEGDGIRAWLSLDRFVDPSSAGRVRPSPYQTSADDAPDPAPPNRRLDFVRRPLSVDGDEPLARAEPGASIAEWRWLEAEQIEQLRQQALVLVSGP